MGGREEDDNEDNGNDEKAKIVEEPKEVNPNELTPDCALQFAASNGNVEDIRKYQKLGGNVNQAQIPDEPLPGEEKKMTGLDTTEAHDYPLHLAAQGGHVEAVNLLFFLEANLENKNRWGSTALHRAVSTGHLEVVEELLKLGSTWNAVNRIGNTPLHVAAFCGHLEIARVLLNHGAHQGVYIKNRVEMTPWDYAKKKPMQNLFLNYQPGDATWTTIRVHPHSQSHEDLKGAVKDSKSNVNLTLERRDEKKQDFQIVPGRPRSGTTDSDVFSV